MGLNRIVNQLFEGVTFGLTITKHLLVTDGNKNNWSQTSPRSKINSRGENVKKNDQWKCTMMINQFLLSVENFLYRHYSQLSPKQKAFIWRATLRREPMNTRARLYSV